MSALLGGIQSCCLFNTSIAFPGVSGAECPVPPPGVRAVYYACANWIASMTLDTTPGDAAFGSVTSIVMDGTYKFQLFAHKSHTANLQTNNEKSDLGEDTYNPTLTQVFPLKFEIQRALIPLRNSDLAYIVELEGVNNSANNYVNHPCIYVGPMADAPAANYPPVIINPIASRLVDEINTGTTSGDTAAGITVTVTAPGSKRPPAFIEWSATSSSVHFLPSDILSGWPWGDPYIPSLSTL